VIAESEVWSQQSLSDSLRPNFRLSIAETKVNPNLPHYALLVLHVRDTLID